MFDDWQQGTRQSVPNKQVRLPAGGSNSSGQQVPNWCKTYVGWMDETARAPSALEPVSTLIN